MSPVEDNIYNLCSDALTAKDLRKVLDRKYKTEESGDKKYIVSRYGNFKMIDDKQIIHQVHDLQAMVNEIIKEGTQFDEQFRVVTIIEKLPRTWKDIQKALWHKRKDYSLEYLHNYLTIEKEARVSNQMDLAKYGGKINVAKSKSKDDSEKKAKPRSTSR